MRRRLKRQVFALLLALVLLGGGSSVDGARRAPPPRAAPGSLFERQPLGFDGTTVQRIVTGVRSLPQRLPELVREQGAALGVIGALSDLNGKSSRCSSPSCSWVVAAPLMVRDVRRRRAPRRDRCSSASRSASMEPPCSAS